MAATHTKTVETIYVKNGHFKWEKTQYAEFDDYKSNCIKYICPPCIFKDYQHPPKSAEFDQILHIDGF